MGQACCTGPATQQVDVEQGAPGAEDAYARSETEGLLLFPLEPARPKSFKVCVVGGAGAVGQNLCLLLALNPLVRELVVFDVDSAATPPDGVASDLSQTGSGAILTAHMLPRGSEPVDTAAECLVGCQLVVVSAGEMRKVGMSSRDLLNTNAGIARQIVEACIKHCPEATIALMVNPLVEVVSAMGQMLRQQGLSPLKVLGVTTLDCMRAETFANEVATSAGAPCSSSRIPVIGGHAGSTVLPLFSQAGLELSGEDCSKLDLRVQDAAKEVATAMAGRGGAHLSSAVAASRLAGAVLAGFAGERPQPECAFVASTVTEVPFFSSPVTFGEGGVEEVHPPPLDSMSARERTRLEQLLPLLQAEVAEGLEYAAGLKLGK